MSAMGCFRRHRVAGLFLGASLAPALIGVAGASVSRHSAPSSASSGVISAHLAKTSFRSAQAGNVKLVYRFSRPARRFSYLLGFKASSGWLTIRRSTQKGSFEGSHTVTVKKLFSGKPVKAGRYRLKLTADTSSKLLAFTVCVSPTIRLTSVPAYGSSRDLRGSVSCAAPASHKVAVYIYVSGWWTKPSFASPLTSIRPDGSWTADITTGGSDQLATRIAAFLLPNGYRPPVLSGGPALPAALSEHALASVTVNRKAKLRTIHFSGYSWYVKTSKTLTGPGPNYFSGDPKDVWVDSLGRLHLRIVKRSGRWYCSEVYSARTFGYGSYTFALASRVDRLDRNAVAGLFTWDEAAPEFAYREIDIEFSRWGEEAAPNAQFVVQPWQHAGNRHRFDLALTGTFSTHSFDWSAGSIRFSSQQGHAPALGDTIESWSYTGADIPPPGAGQARINLWLSGGAPPSNGRGLELVVESFKFAPGA